MKYFFSSNQTSNSTTILNEFNRMYDMIINFKNLIARALMGTKRQNFNLFTDSLNNVRLFDFNESTSSTPHLMSTSVEQIVNIAQDAFKKLIHELISTSHELNEHVQNEKKLRKAFEDEINDLKFRYDRLAKQQQPNVKLPKINKNNEDNSVDNESIKFNNSAFNSARSSENSGKRIPSSSDATDYRVKFEENKAKINELEKIVTNLKQEIEMMMMSKSDKMNNTDDNTMTTTVTTTTTKYKQKKMPTDREGDDAPSIMFTKLDAERNAKRLKKAIIKGIVSEQEYQVKTFSFYSIPELFESELI